MVTKNMPENVADNVTSPYQAFADSIVQRVDGVSIKGISENSGMSDRAWEPYFQALAGDEIRDLVSDNPSIIPPIFRHRENALKSEMAGQKHQYEEQVEALEDSLAGTHEQYQGEARQLENDLQFSQNINHGSGALGLVLLGLAAYRALRRKSKR